MQRAGTLNSVGGRATSGIEEIEDDFSGVEGAVRRAGIATIVA
jgi:hypothetical protein